MQLVLSLQGGSGDGEEKIRMAKEMMELPLESVIQVEGVVKEKKVKAGSQGVSTDLRALTGRISLNRILHRQLWKFK